MGNVENTCILFAIPQVYQRLEELSSAAQKAYPMAEAVR